MSSLYPKDIKDTTETKYRYLMGTKYTDTKGTRDLWLSRRSQCNLYTPTGHAWPMVLVHLRTLDGVQLCVDASKHAGQIEGETLFTSLCPHASTKSRAFLAPKLHTLATLTASAFAT
eukprot:COSAG03_NODE_7045_length_971_cov_1.633028_1_plen_117_part_00